MGKTWKTPEQAAFLQQLVPSYHRETEDGRRKEFWKETFEAWFKRFPLEDPTPVAVQEAGSEAKAAAQGKAKKIKVSQTRNQFIDTTSPLVQQIKRFFSRTSDSGSTNRSNLHLEDSVPRRLSELHTYMTLYYDTRVRKTVLARWEEDRIPQLESNITTEIPEDEVRPEDSVFFKDMRIPICYKQAIAQELWENEGEAIKAEVRSHRNTEVATKTVYDTDGEERLKLLREYIKWVVNNFSCSSFYSSLPSGILRVCKRTCRMS
jgi:hypothetical protein